MFITFFNEFTKQSNTALSFGTLLIVFKGLSTLNTRNDFIVERFVAAGRFLKNKISNVIFKFNSIEILTQSQIPWKPEHISRQRHP